MAYLLLFILSGVFWAASCNNLPTSAAGGGGGTIIIVKGPLHMGPFVPGQCAKYTFSAAGSYGYHCASHRTAGMTGTVLVDSDGVDSVVVQIAASGLRYTPALAHVKPGGYVRWINTSSATDHTVTSD